MNTQENGCRLGASQATSDKTSDKSKRLIDANALSHTIRGIAKNMKRPMAVELACLVQIAEQPTVDATEVIRNQWIPVTERLPNARENVLVVAWWHEKWQALLGWYSESNDMWYISTPAGDIGWIHVTYWMPLPEPPREEPHE